MTGRKWHDGPMAVPVTVHIAAAPPDGVDQFVNDIRTIGLEPTVRTVPTRRGVSDFAWLILALPIKAFFETLVEQFAGDAYARLKTLTGTALRHHGDTRDNRRVMLLQDSTTGLQVVLESDLPLAAYRQLFLVNLPDFAQGPLRYDRDERGWRAQLDDREQRNHHRGDPGRFRRG